MSRLIDKDRLMSVLNDNWLAMSPKNADSEEVKAERNAMCMGIDYAFHIVSTFPEINGWISAKDRLPDMGVKCLIYRDGMMSVAKHIANNDWITQAFFTYPTHWMPLPEPPKDGDHDV